MTLMQAQPDVAAQEIPGRGGNDMVRPPRALLLEQQHADECVLDTGLARKLLEEGGYRRLPVPSVVVYRIEAGGHQQTGIVVEASVQDYREGRIRKHEATQPERERLLDMSTADAGFEQLPVTLTHTGRDGLHAMLQEVTSGTPRLRMGSAGESTHTVWVADDPDLQRAVRGELGGIDRLYIADGHHRIAAAERYASRRARPASAFTLAVLFPREQMRVLGYHRCLHRPAGYSTAELLAAVAAQPAADSVEPYAAEARPAAGEVAMYLDGQWFRITLTAPGVHADARASLDAVALDERVLAPLARSVGLDPDDAVTPVPGSSPREFTRWCELHGSIGFVPCPPSVDGIMAVSDADQVMPPKSTWFDPKAGAGIFLRELQ